MLSDPTGWIDFYVSSKVGATRGTMFSFVEINDATDLITGADNKY